MFTAEEVFDIAIRMERNGEQLYRKALDFVSAQSLRDALLWLADQEVRHRKRFTEMKSAVESKSDDLWAQEMSGAILQGVVSHRAFSLEEVDIGAIDNERDLMQTAIEFEEDCITFYEIIRSFVQDADTLGHIDKIIDEERRHAGFFRERQKSTMGDCSEGGGF